MSKKEADEPEGEAFGSIAPLSYLAAVIHDF